MIISMIRKMFMGHSRLCQGRSAQASESSAVYAAGQVNSEPTVDPVQATSAPKTPDKAHSMDKFHAAEKLRKKYERKLKWVNESFQRTMQTIDADPLAGVKTTRKLLRSVIASLIDSKSSNLRRMDIRALWAFAKSTRCVKFPQLEEETSDHSILTGLAWIEQGVEMELTHLQPGGTYWGTLNGIDYPVTPYDARLVTLIAHVAAIYFLRVAEDNEQDRIATATRCDENDIPF